MTADDLTSPAINRRAILRGLGAIGLAAGSGPALAAADAILPLPGGPRERALSSAFPGKAEMIVQRTSSPLLETPFGVFDRDVFTPNDRFYVRWHLTSLPDAIDVDSYRLAVRGHVDRPLSLSLKDIMDLPRVEIAAVNQCSGNSRGFFQPRIPGGQWGNGAMGNARWTGCSLRAVLDKAGVKSGAVGVRMRGLDRHIVEGAPNFLKTLGLDHASDGEVMIAYAMNGEPLPLLNGFPLRVVVPGWFATYWVKMLEDIEVLDAPDENFWMKTAYLIPDTPRADMAARAAGCEIRADQSHDTSLLFDQCRGRRHGAIRNATEVTGHSLWRRLRCRASRRLARPGRHLAPRRPRQRRRKIQLPPFRDDSCSGCARRCRDPGPLRQR